jgi:peptide/nickel transport system substrate-binding protein
MDGKSMPAPKAATLIVFLFIVTLSPFIEGQEKKPVSGGTLAFGAAGDLSTLNPFREGVATNNYIRTLVYEGLTARDKEMGIVPGLASAWTTSKDGAVYTFHLRPRVKFHNGKELEARDVKWSFDYILEAKNAAYMRSNLTEIAEVEAPDSLTVRIRLRGPVVSFPATISTSRVPIIPADTVISPDAFPPGTGPFQFVSWTRGTGVTFKKFKDYWQKGLPYLDQVIFRPILDDTIRATALRSGDIQVAASLDPELSRRILSGEVRGLSVATAPGAANGYLRLQFNLAKPPFSDQRLRLAVVLALDKSELCSGFGGGVGHPASQRYPNGHFWHLPIEDRKPDHAKSRLLLQEAGYPKGFSFSIPSHNPETTKAATILKAELARVGIQLEIQPLDFATRDRQARQGDFTALLGGEGLLPDPDTSFSRYYHSKSRNNYIGFRNAEVDRLIEAARRTHDVRERKAMYTKVLQILMAEIPEVSLCQTPEFFGIQQGVMDFTVDVGGSEYVYAGGGLSHTWMKK